MASKVRSHVEHILGFQQNGMGGKPIRTILLARAAVKISLINMACNLSATCKSPRAGKLRQLPP